MKIVVCIKQVPDTTDVKIDSKTKNLVREGVPSIINPFDECGIDVALTLKDRIGGKITALCMGPMQAKKELEHCLKLGVDDALLLCDKKLSGSDTLATGYSLASIISKIGFDLIICGVEAIDGCTGQVGPGIAENLGIPQFTYVRDIDIKNGKIIITREAGKYIETYECPLPALVCVLKKELKKRSLKEANKEVTVMDASSLNASQIGIDGSPTRVVNVEVKDSKIKTYVDVDYNLSCEERIRYIINGGIEYKDIELISGNVKDIVKLLVSQEFTSCFTNK